MKDNRKGGRPIALAILCVLGLFGCFLKTIIVLSPIVQDHGRWYAVYLSLSTVLMIACLSGLWLMKKWAFWAFLVYAVVDQCIYYAMSLWDPKTFLLVPLILLTSIIYYRRLN